MALENIMPFTIGLHLLQLYKRGITYVFSHNYAKINIDSDDDLSLEKKITLHNVLMLIESVFKENNYQ